MNRRQIRAAAQSANPFEQRQKNHAATWHGIGAGGGSRGQEVTESELGTWMYRRAAHQQHRKRPQIWIALLYRAAGIGKGRAGPALARPAPAGRRSYQIATRLVLAGAQPHLPSCRSISPAIYTDLRWVQGGRPAIHIANRPSCSSWRGRTPSICRHAVASRLPTFRAELASPNPRRPGRQRAQTRACCGSPGWRPPPTHDKQSTDHWRQ